MKKLIFYPILACLFMATTASTCSSDDDSSSSSNPAPVINTVTQGTWRITSFVEDGNDHTNYFTGYSFTFGSGNALTAINSGTTVSGFWSVTDSDNSDDDSPHSDLDFNIMFSSPNNFTELNEDWDILERTDSKIRLRHVSGGDGSIDILTFEKN